MIAAGAKHSPLVTPVIVRTRGAIGWQNGSDTGEGRITIKPLDSRRTICLHGLGCQVATLAGGRHAIDWGGIHTSDIVGKETPNLAVIARSAEGPFGHHDGVAGAIRNGGDLDFRFLVGGDSAEGAPGVN